MSKRGDLLAALRVGSRNRIERQVHVGTDFPSRNPCQFLKPRNILGRDAEPPADGAGRLSDRDPDDDMTARRV